MSFSEDDISNPILPENGSSSPEAASAAGAAPAPIPSFPLQASAPPGELRTSSYWIHFIVFVIFAFGSLVILQTIVATYLASERHLSMKAVEKAMTTEAPIAVVVQVAWFSLLLLFLYMTLGVLRGAPFWPVVGWHRFTPREGSASSPAWRYLLAGAGLAILVAVTGSKVSPKEHLPIQELFKNRSGVLLIMSLAVVVAPLVEETLFRGYLYPLFARSFGVPAGIVLTGLLFGLLHGSQLGWTWGLVSLLTVVGIIFTYARARTGTVLASYLLHLGYNSMIAISTVAATHGLQKI